jgi:hypothetical protein
MGNLEKLATSKWTTWKESFASCSPMSMASSFLPRTALELQGDRDGQLGRDGEHRSGQHQKQIDRFVFSDGHGVIVGGNDGVPHVAEMRQRRLGALKAAAGGTFIVASFGVLRATRETCGTVLAQRRKLEGELGQAPVLSPLWHRSASKVWIGAVAASFPDASGWTFAHGPI